MSLQQYKPLTLILVSCLVAILLSSCGDSGAEPAAKNLSFEEAAQLVLDEVVQPDGLDHEVIVFGWPETLTADDELTVYAAEDLTTPGETIEVEEESWFFWIDDAPGAYFVHPNRYVIVSVEEGAVSTSNQEWWPVLNGRGLWLEEAEYWDQANWIYSNLEASPSTESRFHGTYKLAQPAVSPSFQQETGPNFAMVVNGWSTGQGAKKDMEQSREDMEKLLKKSGFGTDTIKPGEPNAKNRLRDWIKDRAKDMQTSQTAMIYLTGHGNDIGGVGVFSIGGEILTENELTDWLNEFHPGVHLIVVIDSCHAGDWKDGLQEVADVTVASTGEGQWAAGDLDAPDDPNPADLGGEYTSGFFEDWNLIIESTTTLSPIASARAYEYGTNYWEEVAMMSHETAVEKDYYAIKGYNDPEAVRGNPFTTKHIPITPYLDHVNAGPMLTMSLMGNLQQDGTGDGHVSTIDWDINDDVSSVGINWWAAFWLAFGEQGVDDYFNKSYFDCGTQVGDALTFCVQGAGDIPPGDVLLGMMVLDEDIPLDPGMDIYQYGFVLDSDNDPANNFQYVPPYTLDYFQETDLWYVVYYQDGWQLSASRAMGGQVNSNARAAIIKNILVFFVPMDEIEAEFPSYRFSAFGCVEGGWGSGFCNGDVSGEDATHPPLPLPQEKIEIE
jgi:hypothetical protein